jgi:hypothetical protein
VHRIQSSLWAFGIDRSPDEALEQPHNSVYTKRLEIEPAAAQRAAWAVLLYQPHATLEKDST